MKDFDVVEPAIDPNNRIGFLLDWELTLKCNLDCSYCSVGLYGGHDNSLKHPPANECIDALTFMFEYVDLYMQIKPKGLKYVVLNVYGGESLHHPNIVDILDKIQSKYQPYRDHWHLTVTTTTNAIVSDKKLQQIIPYIDEFTISYHPENSPKQKEQFRKNLLAIKASEKRQKCVVIMPNNDLGFEDSVTMINWLEQNSIKFIPRQLDGIHTNDVGLRTDNMVKHALNTVIFADAQKRIYSEHQVRWFNQFYNSKIHGNGAKISFDANDQELGNKGRACCGGRQICLNQNYKERNFFIKNQFPHWYCSVNQFFLFVKQVTGEIFTNKDCRMNYDGSIGPIGNLKQPEALLSSLRNQIETNSLPIIQCKKTHCICGLCAPKAKNLDTYNSIMEKYQRL